MSPINLISLCICVCPVVCVCFVKLFCLVYSGVFLSSVSQTIFYSFFRPQSNHSPSESSSSSSGGSCSLPYAHYARSCSL